MTDRTTMDVEAGIRETRDRMSEDIDAIGEKLNPARIKERAKATIRRKAQETGAGLVRAARENPLPAAMVLVGLTWLMRVRDKGHRGFMGEGERFDDSTLGLHDKSEQLKDKAQELAESGREKIEHLAETGKAKIGQLTHRVADSTRRAGSSVQHFFQDNPLIGSAAVVVLGAAVGALLPHTRKEDELIGPARDRMLHQAGDAMNQAFSESHR